MNRVFLELGFNTSKLEEFYRVDKAIKENLTEKEIELLELGIKSVQNMLFVGMERYVKNTK